VLTDRGEILSCLTSKVKKRFVHSSFFREFKVLFASQTATALRCPEYLLRVFEIGIHGDMIVSGSFVDSQRGNKLPPFSFQGSIGSSAVLASSLLISFGSADRAFNLAQDRALGHFPFANGQRASFTQNCATIEALKKNPEEVLGLSASPVESTLTELPLNIDFNRLTGKLSHLESTFTKTGEGVG
jgi:hypothetical protein